MNDEPVVSVIMALYNGRAHCRAALASVLEQRRPPQEVIVVDDGSTDGSADVIREVPSDLPIKVVQQPNRGQSAARNAGARLASGTLLAFIDQDDLWHRDHLQELIGPFASRTDLGWTYSDFDEIDGQSRTVTRGFIAVHGVQHSRKTLTGFLESDLMILPSASVVSAAAFRSVDGFDPDLCGYEDDDLFIRLFRAGWDSEFIPASLTRYRVHHTGASAGARFRESRIRFYNKLIVDVPDDARLNRYYIDDVLFPRLLRTTWAEYLAALKMREFDRAREIAETIAHLTERAGGLRRALGIALLRRPERFLPLLKIHRRLPSALRRHVFGMAVKPATPRL